MPYQSNQKALFQACIHNPKSVKGQCPDPAFLRQFQQEEAAKHAHPEMRRSIHDRNRREHRR
jgi:hypothetical protein